MPTKKTTKKTAAKTAAPKPAAKKATKASAATKYTPEVVKLTGHLLKTTEAALGRFFATDGGAIKLSEKAQKIQDYITTKMSGYQSQTAELMALLTGEPISATSGSLDTGVIKKGCLLVPTGNSNGHDYTVGEVVMTTGERLSSLLKGVAHGETRARYGNTLTNILTELRLPTEDEALEFTSKNYDNICASLGVVIL